MTAKRLVPLSGIVSVALVVVALILGGEPPDADDPLQEVTTFYRENDQTPFSILLALAMFFFLSFSSVLRESLRRAGERGTASALGFAGAIVFAVGALIFAGIGFTLGEEADHIEPAALQTLHVLNIDMFFPLAVGTLAFLVGNGIAVVETGSIPKWLGWVAIVGGIFAITPVWFVPFIVLALFILVVSVLLSLRAETAPGPRPSERLPPSPPG